MGSVRELRFNSQHPCGPVQPSITLVPEDPTPSSVLSRHQVHKCRPDIHRGKTPWTHKVFFIFTYLYLKLLFFNFVYVRIWVQKWKLGLLGVSGCQPLHGWWKLNSSPLEGGVASALTFWVISPAPNPNSRPTTVPRFQWWHRPIIPALGNWSTSFPRLNSVYTRQEFIFRETTPNPISQTSIHVFVCIHKMHVHMYYIFALAYKCP